MTRRLVSPRPRKPESLIINTPPQTNSIFPLSLMVPLPQFLFFNDAECRTTFSIVFGSSDDIELEQRIRHGCHLYLSRLTSRLVLTGDGRFENRFRESEAARMAEMAVLLGVPREYLHIEDRSNTTVENVKQCYQMVGEIDGLVPNRVALVSSAWHMYRVLIVAEHFFPYSTQFFCHPTTEGWNADNWDESHEGVQLVKNELRLIEQLHEEGVWLPKRIYAYERNARMRERPDGEKGTS